MAFFARPNLDNTQFKQLDGGEPLTLSGQTQIATTSGLTLIGDGGTYIPIIATGASNNFVLTYDNTQEAIILKEATASGGTGIYDGASPTTCTVGGLTSGSEIYNDSLVDIIQCMVSPTLYPSLTNPSVSLSISPSTTTYEVGTVINLTGIGDFNAGSISPQYSPTTSSCRSNGTNCYSYTAFGLPYTCIINDTSNNYDFGSHEIPPNSSTISAKVYYKDGVQPYDSSGNVYDSPLSSGITPTVSRTISGIYPWYWGIESSGGAAAGVNRPTACEVKDVITGGTANKEVESSTNTISTTFNSTSDDYIWFATPVGSTTKTCWYVDALNNNQIGGTVSSGGNLFPDPDNMTDIDTVCWSGQEYKIYISNYQTAGTTEMQLRNS